MPSPTPLPGKLVIVEVLYDPIGSEPENEWIEFANIGGLPLELSGYKFGDEETFGGKEGMFQSPAGAWLEPGQVIIVANLAAAFRAVYGFAPSFEIRESYASIPNVIKYSAWSGGNVELENQGDEVLLLNNSDQAIDALSWGNSTFAFYPPVHRVAEGHTLERSPAYQDTDSAADWIDQPQPTPGFAPVNTPTPTDTATATETQLPSSTPTLTASASPTITFTPYLSGTPTSTHAIPPTFTFTATVTNTPSPTNSQTPTLTVTHTVTSTSTHSATPTHTLTPSVTLTPTPTSQPTPYSAWLLISEVMYYPNSTEPDAEWIELHNAGGGSLDLSAYKLGDEETQGGGEGMARFPVGAAILHGQVLVFANQATTFYASYGYYPDYELRNSLSSVPDMLMYSTWASGSVELRNDGDEIILLNNYDLAVDAVSWGDSSWAFSPSVPKVVKGHSIERKPVYMDSDRAGDWVDQSTPAPGKVDPPSSTATATLTSTATGTSTPTSTWTMTSTPTLTWTITPTPSLTVTPTRTETATYTTTPTLTSTATFTHTLPPINTLTSTSTPTVTVTSLSTDTQTPTGTGTPTLTRTSTLTVTPTQTITPTAKESETPTLTLTGTATHTHTPTISITFTPTLTSTVTPTQTGTQTATVTSTPTETGTPTPTTTPTPTLTPTPISTDTPTPTTTSTPTSPPVVILISEVIYNPVDSEPAAEWIELYNPSGVTVDLHDYKVGDEETQGGR